MANTRVERDRELFQEFLRILPHDGSIAFIRNDFFTRPFELRLLSDIDAFIARWNNAEHEFLDADLEARRRELMHLIITFRGNISTNTFTTQVPGENSIPVEWRTAHPAQFDEIVNSLQEQAAMIGETYDRLVREGLQRLHQ